MHLHPSGGAASKGRCQWLIWNRCDRLIMLHSGKSADQEGGSGLGEWATACFLFVFFSPRFTPHAGQYVPGTPGTANARSPPQKNHPNCQSADYYEEPVGRWLGCLSTKGDFIGSIMAECEIIPTIVTPHCARVFVRFPFSLLSLSMFGFIPPEETHNVTLLSSSDEWKHAMLSW